VLAETVGGDAAVLPLRVTGPEMVFELSTTAPLTEAIVTGPVTLLPWTDTGPPPPSMVTGPTSWSGPHDDPAGPPNATGPAVPVIDTGPRMVEPQMRMLEAPLMCTGPVIVPPITASAPPWPTFTGPLMVPLPSTQVPGPVVRAPLEEDVMVVVQLTLVLEVVLDPV